MGIGNNEIICIVNKKSCSPELSIQFWFFRNNNTGLFFIGQDIHFVLNLACFFSLLVNFFIKFFINCKK